MTRPYVPEVVLTSDRTELQSQSHDGRVNLLRDALGEDSRWTVSGRRRTDDFDALRAFGEQQRSYDEKLVRHVDGAGNDEQSGSCRLACQPSAAGVTMSAPSAQAGGGRSRFS